MIPLLLACFPLTLNYETLTPSFGKGGAGVDFKDKNQYKIPSFSNPLGDCTQSNDLLGFIPLFQRGKQSLVIQSIGDYTLQNKIVL